MKRLIAMILGLVFALSLISAGCAEGSSALAMVMVPIDAQDMRLGQCMVPQGYTVTPTLDICGETRSVTDPIGLGIIAVSPDGRIILSYEKSSTYIELVSSTMGGQTYRFHEDGKYDIGTMTLMARYKQPDAYALTYLAGAFPGVEMTYVGALDLSVYQPMLQEYAQKQYDLMTAGHPELMGLNIDGVSIYAGVYGYTCEMNGETYDIVVATVIEATQMTIGSGMLQGYLSETEIVWSPLCTYMLACPDSEFGNAYPAFEVFMENTTVSDQFTAANQALADNLRQIIVDTRMATGRYYCTDILGKYTDSDDTYDDERMTDYIFDQNDYTLSDGTHVKIPTSYDYVYEGDNGVIYYSDSAFPEPGKQLMPNR